MQPTFVPAGTPVTVPSARVLDEQLKNLLFTTIEVTAARRLTGWRRVALLAIAAHNVVRFVQTAKALHQHVKALDADAQEA